MDVTASTSAHKRTAPSVKSSHSDELILHARMLFTPAALLALLRPVHAYCTFFEGRERKLVKLLLIFYCLSLVGIYVGVQ